jgi:hypothetical protein
LPIIRESPLFVNSETLIMPLASAKFTHSSRARLMQKTPYFPGSFESHCITPDFRHVTVPTSS